jgi:hypothetical protein
MYGKKKASSCNTMFQGKAKKTTKKPMKKPMKKSYKK